MSNKLPSALEGNFGEHFVAAQLAAGGCLVRPVPNQADTGIDLYCETSPRLGSAHVPFVHFWVQVKTSFRFPKAESEKLFVVLPDDIEHSALHPVRIEIGEDNYNYWMRQPIPVYVICVCIDAWPPTRQPTMQILPMTDVFLGEHTCLDISKRAYACSLELKPYDQCARHAFFNDIVRTHAAALNVRNGVISPLPQLVSSNARKSVIVPSYRFLAEIVEQIKNTAAMSIISAYFRNTLPNLADDPRSRVLEKIVELFANTNNLSTWEDWLALGLLYSHRTDRAMSAQCFSKAAALIDIHSDAPEMDDDPIKNGRLTEIKSWLELIAKNGDPSIPFFGPKSMQ